MPRRILPCTLLLLSAACAQRPAPPAPAPEKPKVESELGRTTLHATHVKSLGIETAEVKNRPVQEHLPLTGWIMARQGNEVVVTAPVGGYVRDPKDGRLPVAGLMVANGQELLVLEPVLSPVEQIQLAALKRSVESEIVKARESVTLAESELARVQDLHKQGLRGTQDVDQSRVRAGHAKEDLITAEDKRKLFAPGGVDAVGRPPALVLRAPRAGTTLAVPVSPGQYVPAAAPLVTIADLSQLWVRVPVPEHYLPQLDRDKPIKVMLKAGAPGSSRTGKTMKDAAMFSATPVALVPLVDTVKHTADMHFALEPSELTAKLAKDQMVTAYVLLGKQRDETVLPYSAIIFDAYAGTWIYVDQTPKDAAQHVYHRRRVELGPAVDGGVVVRPKLKDGERVVVKAAASLFSREFHVPPVAAPTPVDDDD